MPRALSSPLHVARTLLEKDSAWLLFAEIDLGEGTFLRVVRDTQHRTANGVQWQRAAIEIELPEETASGTLGTLAFTVSNVSRIPIAYVETDQLLGRPISVYLAYETSLASFEASLAWQHKILDLEAGERVARVVCGHSAQMLRVPGPLFDRRTFPQLLPTSGVRL